MRSDRTEDECDAISRLLVVKTVQQCERQHTAILRRHRTGPYQHIAVIAVLVRTHPLPCQLGHIPSWGRSCNQVTIVIPSFWYLFSPLNSIPLGLKLDARRIWARLLKLIPGFFIFNAKFLLKHCF